MPVQNYTWHAPLLGTPSGALRRAASAAPPQHINIDRRPAAEIHDSVDSVPGASRRWPWRTLLQPAQREIGHSLRAALPTFRRMRRDDASRTSAQTPPRQRDPPPQIPSHHHTCPPPRVGRVSTSPLKRRRDLPRRVGHMCTQPHAAGFTPTGARDRALHAQKSAHHAAATTPRNKWHTRGKVLHALHGPRRRDTWRQFENSNASLKLSGRPLIAKTHAHHIAAHTLACGSARSRQPPLDRARRQQAPTGGCLQPPWRLEANYGHGHRAHQGVRG